MKYLKVTDAEAYYIRYHFPIAFDPEDPFCFECGEVWSRYKNKYYHERYCHRCGRSWKTCQAHPFCDDCVHLDPPKDRIPEIKETKEELLKKVIISDCPPHDWVRLDWVGDRKQEQCNKCGKHRHS